MKGSLRDEIQDRAQPGGGVSQYRKKPVGVRSDEHRRHPERDVFGAEFVRESMEKWKHVLTQND